MLEEHHQNTLLMAFNTQLVIGLWAR